MPAVPLYTHRGEGYVYDREVRPGGPEGDGGRGGGGGAPAPGPPAGHGPGGDGPADGGPGGDGQGAGPPHGGAAGDGQGGGGGGPPAPPLPLRSERQQRKTARYCDVCDRWLNDENAYITHTVGRPHKKRWRLLKKTGDVDDEELEETFRELAKPLPVGVADAATAVMARTATGAATGDGESDAAAAAGGSGTTTPLPHMPVPAAAGGGGAAAPTPPPIQLREFIRGCRKRFRTWLSGPVPTPIDAWISRCVAAAAQRGGTAGKAISDGVWVRLDAVLQAGAMMSTAWDYEPVPAEGAAAAAVAAAAPPAGGGGLVAGAPLPTAWREDPFLDGGLELCKTLANGEDRVLPDVRGSNVQHWGDSMPEPKQAFTRKRRREGDEA